MAPSDLSALATIATAFMIRDGGKVVFSEAEWEAAIAHESTLYVAKQTDGPIVVVLIPKEGAHD